MQPRAPIPEPGPFVITDGAAGLDRLADGDERLVYGQRHWWRFQPVQPAQQR
jgi:hypothetical protein